MRTESHNKQEESNKKRKAKEGGTTWSHQDASRVQKSDQLVEELDGAASACVDSVELPLVNVINEAVSVLKLADEGQTTSSATISNVLAGKADHIFTDVEAESCAVGTNKLRCKGSQMATTTVGEKEKKKKGKEKEVESKRKEEEVEKRKEKRKEKKEKEKEEEKEGEEEEKKRKRKRKKKKRKRKEKGEKENFPSNIQERHSQLWVECLETHSIHMRS